MPPLFLERSVILSLARADRSKLLRLKASRKKVLSPVAAFQKMLAILLLRGLCGCESVVWIEISGADCGLRGAQDVVVQLHILATRTIRPKISLGSASLVNENFGIKGGLGDVSLSQNRQQLPQEEKACELGTELV